MFDSELNLEAELFALERELRSGNYQPRPYRLFVIKARKRREIAAAAFRDRVVQHSIMLVLEPHLEQCFITHSYACRKGKGVHRAVDQYQRWAQHYNYCMKLDIQRYFPQVDHLLLKKQLRLYIQDVDLLYCLANIVDSYPEDDLSERPIGMPIGNLTSQIFANLYLNQIDHFLAAQSNIRYLRYVDYFIVLGRDKESLWQLKASLSANLQCLHLNLHPRKAQVMRVTERLDILGYKVSRGRRWLRNDNGHRFN